MKLEDYGVIELNDSEKEMIDGGGAIGRVVGWILGLGASYIEYGKQHSDMSETSMLCM